MEKQEIRISVRDLTEEIVATYTGEENALQVHFLNGQNFRIKVEEML